MGSPSFGEFGLPSLRAEVDNGFGVLESGRLLHHAGRARRAFFKKNNLPVGKVGAVGDQFPL